MTDKELEQYLGSIKWQDIKIILTKENDSFLILICSNQEDSDKLYYLITKNPFNLKVVKNKNETHELHIELINSAFTIGFRTPKTLDTYPPLKLLYNRQITSITCGFKDDSNQLRYNPNLHPLGSKHILLN